MHLKKLFIVLAIRSLPASADEITSAQDDSNPSFDQVIKECDAKTGSRLASQDEYNLRVIFNHRQNGNPDRDKEKEFIRSLPPEEKMQPLRDHYNCVVSVLTRAENSLVEPTEHEMEIAFKGSLPNLSIPRYSMEQCAKIPKERVPELMMCVTGIMTGGMTLSVKDFVKKDCSKIMGSPSYLCDFNYRIVFSGNETVTSMNNLIPPARCSARFVHVPPDQWSASSQDCR